MFECGDEARARGQARTDTFHGARRQETLRRSEGSVFFCSHIVFSIFVCLRRYSNVFL